jgi:hypothetical protein
VAAAWNSVVLLMYYRRNQGEGMRRWERKREEEMDKHRWRLLSSSMAGAQKRRRWWWCSDEQLQHPVGVSRGVVWGQKERRRWGVWGVVCGSRWCSRKRGGIEEIMRASGRNSGVEVRGGSDRGVPPVRGKRGKTG